MQNRILSFCLVFIIAFACVCMPVYAEDDISLVIDNKKIICDVPPVISNSRTLVPARVLFEHFNAKVQWEAELRQVIISLDKKIMIFNIDSTIVYMDGKSITIDVAPVIINDRTLIPIRFVSENLGYDVDWDPDSRTVYVDSPKEEPAPPSDGDENNTKPKLSSVIVRADAQPYEITVTLEEKITPKVMTLSSPERLIFDFYGVNQTCKDGNLKSEEGYVVETRWAEHEEFTRLVVETDGKCVYKIDYTKGKHIIYISDKPIDEDVSAPLPELPDIEISGDAPLVVLDAGHGGYDPGAVGKDDDDNIILYEKEVCLKIVKKVKVILDSKGIDVLLTRSGDTALGSTEITDLRARVRIANDAKADLFVSVHNNAFTNEKPNGTCVLYSGINPNEGYGISSKELAQNIQTHMVQATGLFDRGIVARPNIVVLRETAMPAALIECAFITNPDDQKVLLSDKKLSDMAEAISIGIIESLQTMGKLK